MSKIYVAPTYSYILLMYGTPYTHSFLRAPDNFPAVGCQIPFPITYLDVRDVIGNAKRLWGRIRHKSSRFPLLPDLWPIQKFIIASDEKVKSHKYRLMVRNMSRMPNRTCLILYLCPKRKQVCGEHRWDEPQSVEVKDYLLTAIQLKLPFCRRCQQNEKEVCSVTALGKKGTDRQVTVSDLKGLSKRSQIGFISLSLSCVLSWCCPRCSVAERKRPIIKHESLATLAVCLHVSKGTKSNWGCFLDQDTKDFTDHGGGGSNSRREFSCLGCDRRFASFQVCLKLKC